MIAKKNQCSQTFNQRLQLFAQRFRDEWGIQAIDPIDWDKLVFYARNPQHDSPDEIEALAHETQ